MDKSAALVTIVAIITIGALEVQALAQHIDGSAFGIVVAAIAGLGGYTVRRQLEKGRK